MVCRDDSRDGCIVVDVVAGISSTMVVVGTGCLTSIVRSTNGASVLFFDFLVVDFLTYEVRMTHFFCGLGTVI